MYFIYENKPKYQTKIKIKMQITHPFRNSSLFSNCYFVFWKSLYFLFAGLLQKHIL